MKYTLDLTSIFKILHDYVVIKMSDELPLYQINEDLDILTSDIYKNMNIIKDWYDKKVFYHKYSHVTSTHIHIDLFKHNENFLHFRFDLFSKLEFSKFSIDNSICRMILKNKIKNDRGAYVPCLKDDLSIRYCEYVEYISERPDKIKHFNYVNKFDVDFYKVSSGEIHCKLNYPNYNPIYTNIIVWGHGIKYIDDILNTIMEDIDCSILNITRNNYENVKELIDKCYKLEMVNSTHILNKTMYLQNVPKQYINILIKNYGVNNKQYGEGAFAVTADENIINWKWKIRSKYNPRKQGIHINPLPKGVTHNHVVHVTDTAEEARHLTHALNCKYPSHYESITLENVPICRNEQSEKTKRSHDFLITPWHISRPKKIQVCIVDINTIKVSIIKKGHCKIEETPHYMYVNGKKETYIDYYNENMGISLQDNHTFMQFDNLIKAFDYNQYNHEESRLIIVNSSYICMDGVHRLSILKKENIERVKVAIFL